MSKIPSATTQDNSRLMQALYALNDEAHKNGTAGMSEEEIEAEIKAARATRKKWSPLKPFQNLVQQGVQRLGFGIGEVDAAGHGLGDACGLAPPFFIRSFLRENENIL